MEILISKKLSKKQINEIYTNLLNLPRKLTNSEKIKRIVWDVIIFLTLIINAYINYTYSIMFFLLVTVAIVMIGFAIYYHTNEKKNNIMELLFIRLKGNIKTKSQFEIRIDDDKIIISKNKKNYYKLYKLLSWNNLIVCVVDNEENQKKLAFLNFENNDKDFFINKVEKILNLSLENIDNNTNLNDYIK